MLFNNYQSILLPESNYRHQYFNNAKGTTIEDNDNPMYMAVHNVNHGDTTLKDNNSTRDPFNILVDLKAKKLFQRIQNSFEEIGLPLDSSILLEESTSIINWTLHSEQKIVGKYMCQKATANFRGRDYTVWFAPDIPVSFGPWKLNGLPGIILEASDNSNHVNFRAIFIEVQNSTSIDAISFEKDYEIYSKMQYEGIKWKKHREIEKKSAEAGQRLQAKAPQGVFVTFSTIVSLHGIELEYEFLPTPKKSN